MNKSWGSICLFSPPWKYPCSLSFIVTPLRAELQMNFGAWLVYKLHWHVHSEEMTSISIPLYWEDLPLSPSLLGEKAAWPIYLLTLWCPMKPWALGRLIPPIGKGYKATPPPGSCGTDTFHSKWIIVLLKAVDIEHNFLTLNYII